MPDLRLIDISALPRYMALPKGGDGYILVVPNACLVDAPRVDAEPVRHGMWTNIAGFMACSECGASPADWEAKPDNPLGLPPYCHSCGAKMDKEEETLDKS